MDLPSIIPIFPLPNVVLFPGVPLPLHIFEPRYRDMVRDSTGGHELIGMALLRGDWQRQYQGNPEIFEIGCAGRIVSAEPLEDGRFNILLHGVREFTVCRQIFDRPYRQAEIAWRPVRTAALALTVRDALTQRLGQFLRTLPESPAHRLLRDPSLSDELLVNFVSFALDIDPLEKQGLLQADCLESRARRLTEILEFHLEEARLSPGRPGSERCH
jgi:Lon protease-like protein